LNKRERVPKQTFDILLASSPLIKDCVNHKLLLPQKEGEGSKKPLFSILSLIPDYEITYRWHI
jgi:hypothetical protein